MNLHPTYKTRLQPVFWLLLLLTMVLAASWVAPPIAAVKGIAGYPPLHGLMETVAIVVSMLVFAVCWNGYTRERASNFILLGCVFLGVAILDFLHALSIKGMPDFVTPSDPDKAIDFWLFARLLSAVGLLAVALRPWQPPRAQAVRWLYLAVVLAVAGSAAWLVLGHSDWLPRTFVEGQGLTTFKVVSEYVVTALFLTSSVLFLKKMSTPQPYDVVGLFAATAVMALSELFFTLYSDLADIFLVLGHVYKVIAYGFVYKSIFVDLVREPYQRLHTANDMLAWENTERLRAQKQQQQAMHDLARAQAIAHCGSWRLDLQTNALEWSEETLRMFGVAPGASLDYDFFLSCVHADDVSNVDRAWKQALKGLPFDTEYRIVAGDHIKWVRARAEFAFDPAGTPVSAMGTVQDITERKRIIEALRASEERWKFALEGAGDGVWDWEVQTGALTLSKRWKELLGYAEHEVGGTLAEWEKRIHPDDRQRVMDNLQEQLEGKAPYAVELRLRCKNGDWKWVLDRGMVVSRDPAGKPLRMIGTTADISERKRIEEELRIANATLEARVIQRTHELNIAKKQAEAASQVKSQFLANMSHDIRTPMNSIIGMATLALRTGLDDRQRDYVAKIQQSAQNLLGILNDILDISKVEAGKLHVENRDFLVGHVFEQLSNQLSADAAHKGLWLSFVLAPGMARPLRGDPLRLTQVLTNFIGNAIKFTAQGEITVRAQLLEHGAHGNIARFEVQDTGIGISDDVIPHLFEPFRQGDASTTRKYGGTGLGLAISKQLVELMGGAVGVTSALGKGSTFWFTLTLEEGHASNIVAPAVRFDAASAIQGATILLAEDNAFNQQVARELLEDAGARVVIAENGLEAIELLRQQKFDCVLMDVQMPLMDGFEATRRIRADPELAATRIIAMTANARGEDQAQCRDAGMDDFVSKPIDPDNLLATLRQWLPSRLPPDTGAHPEPL